MYKRPTAVQVCLFILLIFASFYLIANAGLVCENKGAGTFINAIAIYYAICLVGAFFSNKRLLFLLLAFIVVPQFLMLITIIARTLKHIPAFCFLYMFLVGYDITCTKVEDNEIKATDTC